MTIVYAIGFFWLFFVMFLMANRPLPPSDKITLVMMGIYIIGLLVSLKWH